MCQQTSKGWQIVTASEIFEGETKEECFRKWKDYCEPSTYRELWGTPHKTSLYWLVSRAIGDVWHESGLIEAGYVSVNGEIVIDHRTEYTVSQIENMSLKIKQYGRFTFGWKDDSDGFVTVDIASKL